ncbi:MAG: aminoacyl-histidine dipeptidase [Prolixibacteraceae bacterium]
MNKDIYLLEPRTVWENFYKLTQIPRPSYHEEQIQDFIVAFGRSLGLETIKDESGNIIIRKPATPGMETREGVILQGHLDMVPQKNSEKVHDFIHDPIEAYVDGEWVTANGTTLGADNGIGVAAALAVLGSKDLEHGPVEALFTSSEETGMDGAKNLKKGILKGGILLNMDSEDEGELYVGCAGGEDLNARFVFAFERVPDDMRAFKLDVTGLKGGHSGMDIILQRGNANKVFFRLLDRAYRSAGARLASITGGSLRNAIPREAFGVIAVSASGASDLKLAVESEFELIRNELALTEPEMKLTLTETDMPSGLIDELTQVKLTKSVIACPNGVIRLSDNVPGLVETSSNLAMISSNEVDGTIGISFLMRSSVDSAKDELARRLEALFTLAGADVSLSGSYPGWKPNLESPILKTMSRVYKEKYGKTPEIKAIHAGLECGILGGSYPDWDMISFGPTIRFPHSPDEKVHIASVQKFWDFLKETLKNIPSR